MEKFHENHVLIQDLDIHEILTALGHEQIGNGDFRDVYSFGDDKVIKVARMDQYNGNRRDGIYANMREYEIWQNICDEAFYKKMRKWLAPVHKISKSGILLIQARTIPAKIEELPKKVPNWITDLKSTNGGILNDRYVFHDYNMELMIEVAIKNHKLVSHKNDLWWDL